jgi:hypothetical protein
MGVPRRVFYSKNFRFLRVAGVKNYYKFPLAIEAHHLVALLLEEIFEVEGPRL